MLENMYRKNLQRRSMTIERLKKNKVMKMLM